MRSRYVLIGGIGIAIVATFGVIALTHSKTEKSFAYVTHGRLVVNEDVLDDYFDEHGGEATIAYALEQTKKFSYTNRHAAGHSVGEVLYSRLGIGGAALCGQEFEYGCLHQVVGMAFQHMGTSTIPIFIEKCSEYADPEMKGQCQHGLGHGLMFSNNYDDAKLNEMMKACDTITTVRPLSTNLSCHAGLMMEYNMHQMTMEYEDVNGRPVDTTAPFHTCSLLKVQEDKSLCIWWAVPWIHGRLYDYTYNRATFAKLGAMCDTLDGESLKTRCFSSIGHSIGINANQAPAIAVAFCEAATQSATLQRTCISYAVAKYKSRGNTKDAAAICEYARQTLGIECENVGAID